MCIFRFKVIKLVLMLDAFTPGSGDPLAGPWGPHWDWPTDIQDKMWSECYWSENGSYSNGLVSQWLHCWSCVWTIANFLQPFVRPACDKGSEAWPLRRWTTIVSLFLLSMLHLFSLCVCVCLSVCLTSQSVTADVPLANNKTVTYKPTHFLLLTFSKPVDLSLTSIFTLPGALAHLKQDWVLSANAHTRRPPPFVS